MPINIEEVVIKILANSTQAVSDIKKLDKQVEQVGKTSATSAKSLVGMAAAFGGARGAIDLVVKAVASYVKYIKEAEASYIKMAKEQDKALTDGIKAYDRLNEAKLKSKQLDGQAYNDYMQASRSRRAARIEETNLVKGLTAAQAEQWRAENEGLTRFNKEFESRVAFAARLAEEEKRLYEQRVRYQAYNEYGRMQGVTVAPSGVGAETKSTGPTAAPIDYAALQAKQRLEYINATVAAERVAIVQVNDFRLAAQDAELQRLEELKQAEMELREIRKENAIEALSMASSMFSAIGNLVSNRYQSEIDAAEQGSEKQKELMKKQFNAEKAMAIVQSLIATAVGITKAIPNIPLMVFAGVQGAIQTAAIAATRPPKFATGTPPGGFIVPPGYSGDNYPVMARSGERVTVEPAGGSGGGQTIILQLDGRTLGRAVTNLFDRRQALVPASAVVA